MRSEEIMMSLILNIAKDNDNIRAVLLTGSRANPAVAKDTLQDYDVIYVVDRLEAFTADYSWVNVFGERLIMQLPDEMDIGEKDLHSFHYLMLFADGNRIDLTLYPQEKLHILLQESLLKLLLNKDNSTTNLLPPNDTNYRIKPPPQKAFKDCCNEFWWVSTYVAKGLWRKEIIYAKAMLEAPVRAMFLQMIEWYIGVDTLFTATFNKGRNVQQYLSAELYNQILATYPNSDIAAMWDALFRMTNLFDELANKIANELPLLYDKEEAENAVTYLKRIHAMPTVN